jgi:DMSO reductase family type II enzyme heme b subunit
MGGGAMPSFAFLPDSDRRALVDYVKSISRKTEDGATVEWFAESPSGPALTMTAKPEFTPELAMAGGEIYASLDCATCHGPTGAGDGPLAKGMKDSWGNPLRPRNLAQDPYIGSDSDEAVYHRIAAGIGGTPMVAYADSRLTPDKRWAVVAYIRSLRENAGTLGTGAAASAGAVVVARTQSDLPHSPADPLWENAPASHFVVQPVWRHAGATGSVSVRGLHNGSETALLLEWRNAKPADREGRVQDFVDRAAIQFAMTPEAGFLGMGDPFHPVNIWQWRAGGGFSDPKALIAAVYPDKKRDIYPDAGLLYYSADMAGNDVASIRADYVEEANASGPGTLSLQPDADQDVSASSHWENGTWRVVFRRALEPATTADADLRPGRTVPVAFGVWDGRSGDRNGQKQFSTWQTLTIEP